MEEREKESVITREKNKYDIPPSDLSKGNGLIVGLHRSSNPIIV